MLSERRRRDVGASQLLRVSFRIAPNHMHPTPRTVLVTTPNSDLYGAARMVQESVEGLIERGWRVVVTMPSRGPLTDELRRCGADVRVMPSLVLRKTYLNGRGSLRLLGLLVRSVPASIRLLREVRPDVVYVNTIIQPLWLVLARCARRPVLCHVHEGEASASPMVRRALVWPLLLARRLVVNSRFSTTVLVETVPRLAGRCQVVYNGVAGPPQVTPPRQAVEGEVRLLYVGRLSERKGVADAIDAVAALEERGIPATLDIVGAVFPGYEHVEDQLRRQAREGGIGTNVRFHGFDLDVWSHLAATDILVVPSRTDEPFGNTAVEGALAARPVVATTSGGLVEAIDGLRAGVGVPPGSPGAIAGAVEKLLANWPAVRAHALDDARHAAERYAPATYRTAMTDQVASLVR
jgi:glycosyltransferase involved in cell wall biosynthesis